MVVTCADGGRAFVEAAGTPLNPKTPGLMRAEAAVTGALPASLPAPRLRAHLEWAEDDDQWVALVFEVLDGASPPVPWLPGSAAAVVGALTEPAQAGTPCPLPDLPTLRGFQRRCHDAALAWAVRRVDG